MCVAPWLECWMGLDHWVLVGQLVHSLTNLNIVLIVFSTGTIHECAEILWGNTYSENTIF